VQERLTSIIRDVRYPAIDGIRWYAAFLVFLVHASGPVTGLLKAIPAMHHEEPSQLALRTFEIVSRGQYGVDVFFIISGFLMGRIIASRGEAFSYSDFITSRFVRIYPAFLVSYLICVAYFPHQYGWPLTSYSFFGDLLFLNALPALKVFGYNYVSWSLGFEFAFYLIIPFVLLFRRFPLKYVAAAAILLSFVFIPDAVLRMKALFIGFFISAFADDELKRVAARIPLWPVLLAYAAIVLIYRTAYSEFGYLTFYYSYVVLAAVMFVKVVFEDNFLNRFFSRTSLRVLGTISYSVYLIHPFCISVASAHVLPILRPDRMPTWVAVPTFLAISLTVTLACAALLWYLCERPYFATRRHRPRAAATHHNRTPELAIASGAD
jgi:peptidoglycan/LPS O-acetylase OafA/YrhL